MLVDSFVPFLARVNSRRIRLQVWRSRVATLNSVFSELSATSIYFIRWVDLIFSAGKHSVVFSRVDVFGRGKLFIVSKYKCFGYMKMI